MKYLLAAMIIAVSSSNYLVQFPINHWITLGAFTYPMTFLVTEICNRRYGPKNARKVVYAGFAVAIAISSYLSTPKIAFASATAFLVAQLLDISVFNRLRRHQWWIAPFAASVMASLIDTGVFFQIAFFGEGLPLLSMMFGDFLVKLGLDVFMLLPYRLSINSRKDNTQILINNSRMPIFNV